MEGTTHNDVYKSVPEAIFEDQRPEKGQASLRAPNSKEKANLLRKLNPVSL